MNPVQKILLLKIKKELPSFFQQRYRFYENCEDFTKVIEVQFLNQENAKIAFTIHFGVYVNEVYQIMWNQDKPRIIEAGVCVFYCNINSIISSFKSPPKIKYWDLDNTENLFLEIQQLTKELIYPFTKKINSLEGLNAFMNETEYPGKYVAAYPLFRIVVKSILNKPGEIKELIKVLKLKNPNSYDDEIKDLKMRLAAHGYNWVD